MSKIDLLVDTNAQLSGDNDLIISVHVRSAIDMDNVVIAIDQDGQSFSSETISLKAGDWTAVTFSEGDEPLTLTGVHQHECEGSCYINQNLSEVLEPGSVTASVRAWDQNSEQSHIIEEKQFGLFKDLEDRGLEWFWAYPNLEPFNMIGHIKSHSISQGTGFLIDKQHVLTNAHVVVDADDWASKSHPKDLHELEFIEFSLGRSGGSADFHAVSHVFFYREDWAKTSWKNFNQQETHAHDLAILRLDREVEMTTGEQGYFDLSVTSSIEDVNELLEGSTFDISGYGGAGIETAGNHFQWRFTDQVSDYNLFDGSAEIELGANIVQGHSGSPMYISGDQGWEAFGVLTGQRGMWVFADGVGAAITEDVASWADAVVADNPDDWDLGVWREIPNHYLKDEFFVGAEVIQIEDSYTIRFELDIDSAVWSNQEYVKFDLHFDPGQDGNVKKVASTEKSIGPKSSYLSFSDVSLGEHYPKEAELILFGHARSLFDTGFYTAFATTFPFSLSSFQKNEFTLYDSTEQSPRDLIKKALGNTDGISVIDNSVNYLGAEAAASTFESVDFGGDVRMHHPGVLLTSGDGDPPLSNTSDSYTVEHYTSGDSQFDALAQEAFGGAGTTNDAAILEFQFTVDDPAIKS
ncbi:S1 family peptidase, partial [Ectothiorhodospira haloalkaliphila]|uniref:trypsin-like peptidase domain-containing protein n=1 Tax=Ectothiorhodospira haloalkaliphila TaxID=421628 RepID=UPI001EE84BEB